MAELRWDALHGEWVGIAQADPALGAGAGPCDLCAIASGPGFDVAIVESLPSPFTADPADGGPEASELFATKRPQGASEVVLYTRDHGTTLARQGAGCIDRVVRVWTDRFVELGRLDYVKYVLTLESAPRPADAHPHGRIFGMPFVPPRVQREIEQARAHQDATGRCLGCQILAEERRDGRRVVAETAGFVAYVPFAAHVPVEVHVSPVRHVQGLSDLTREEQRDLAAMLETVLGAIERSSGGLSAWSLFVHQRPTDGHWYDAYHMHVEVYADAGLDDRPTPREAREAGAGVFVNARVPEAAAAALREAAARE